MAQLLYDRQSTNAHLNAVRRHMRLCRQVKGTEKFVSAMETVYNDLIEKQAATSQAKLEREMAYDDVLLNDDILDNKVRSCFEHCKQFDRENSGRPILIIAFPDGKFSGIINAPLRSEPDKVEQLITRLETLGTDHSLNELVAGLKEGANKCKEGLTAYHDAITAQKSTEALEEISQANLRRQYEFNYLDLVKQFGKRNANRFFPVINSSPKVLIDEDNDQEEGVTDDLKG